MQEGACQPAYLEHDEAHVAQCVEDFEGDGRSRLHHQERHVVDEQPYAGCKGGWRVAGGGWRVRRRSRTPGGVVCIHVDSMPRVRWRMVGGDAHCGFRVACAHV